MDVLFNGLWGLKGSVQWIPAASGVDETLGTLDPFAMRQVFPKVL